MSQLAWFLVIVGSTVHLEKTQSPQIDGFAGPPISQESGETKLKKALQLHDQAKLLYEKGRCLDALPLMKDSLRIVEEVQGPNSIDYADCLLGLGVIQDEAGNYKEAEPLLKNSLQIYEAKVGKSELDVCFSLDALAKLYVHMGRYQEAELHSRRSLQINEAKNPKNHAEIIHVSNTLVVVSIHRGRISDAMQLCEQVLQRCEKNLAKDDPLLATSLGNMASIKVRLDKDCTF